MLANLRRLLRRRSPSSHRPQRGRPFRLESLEDRLVPVVAAFGTAPVVPRGMGFDGVVKLEADGGIGSGTLLDTGRHILTAAHLLADEDGALLTDPTNVTFELLDGTTPRDIVVPVAPGAYRVHPSYDGMSDKGNDVALLALMDPRRPTSGRQMVAPFGAERYGLYTGSDELGQVYTVVGYGRTGTGDSGSVEDTAGTKHEGHNRFEADAHLLSAPPFNAPALPPGTALAWDFDNGKPQNDALGTLYGLHDLGLGDQESNPAQGDSGGPLFLDGQVAGIVSYSDGGKSPPDINTDIDRGFGEFGVATRVSAFQDYIHSVTAGPYDLLLDMAYQLAGVDGKDEDLTITADRDGGDLRLGVFGAANPALDGVYYEAPIADVKSLVLRGSAGDHDHFVVAPDLGIPVAVQAAQVVDFGALPVGADGVAENLLVAVTHAGPNLQVQVSGSANPAFDGTYLSVPFDQAASLTLRGGPDHEQVVLGSGLDGLPISVTGGGAGSGDTLDLAGGPQRSVDYTFQGDRTGTISLNPGGTGPALASTVTYSGVERVTDRTAASDRTFTLPDGGARATLRDVGGPDGMSMIETTPGGTVAFANPSRALSVLGGADDDQVTVTSLDADFRAGLTIDGSAGHDTIRLSGSAAVVSLSVRGGAVIVAGGSFRVAAGDAFTPDALTLAGGTLDVGAARLAVGSLSLVGGTLVATPTTQVVATDLVLSGTRLVLTGGADVVRGTTRTLLVNQSRGATRGTFAGLPPGAVVYAAGVPYRIRYAGGDGNDVTLTRLRAVSSQDYAAKLALALFGRPGDGALVAALRRLLDYGMSPRLVVSGLVHSPAYRAAQVDALYATLLHRPADPASRARWLAFLTAGGTREQIQDALAASDEYFRTRGRGTTAGFLRAIYHDELGRGIDAGALEAWQAVLAHGVSRTAVVHVLRTGDEARRLLIQRLYTRYLSRPVDPAGLAAWLRVGATSEQLTIELLTSGEFRGMR